MKTASDVLVDIVVYRILNKVREYKVDYKDLIELLPVNAIEDSIDFSNTEQVNLIYSIIEDFDEGIILDEKIDLHSGDFRIDLPVPYEYYSRHYDSELVGSFSPTGKVLAWVNYSGGGKHGCPEDFNNFEGMTLLDVQIETKTVQILNFSYKEN